MHDDTMQPSGRNDSLMWHNQSLPKMTNFFQVVCRVRDKATTKFEALFESLEGRGRKCFGGTKI
jgi:hypothetical protein